eukprot:2564925-Ditylum_brightwellii.AAC.1
MAASTSLPLVHVNRVSTPNSGCLCCEVDTEGQLNILKQALNHDESTCFLLNNINIRDKSIHDAVKQNNAKNPPQR